MTDIVERLRKFSVFEDCDQFEIDALNDAADEITRLRAQMESQKDEWLSWAEKRDALEQDAARYRWLRDHSCPQVMHPSSYGMGNARGAQLDAATDAAMKA